MNHSRQRKRLCWALWAPFWCFLATAAPAENELERKKDEAGETGRKQELSVPGIPRPVSPQGAPGGIDSLLQLPRGFVTTAPRSVAGASEVEWRRRFRTASSALSEAKTSLSDTKRELDGVAVGGGASQWSVAPPGASGESGSSTSPLSFRLRQQLRADRERVETTEKAMRELRIEADLAGVPESWRNADQDSTATVQN